MASSSLATVKETELGAGQAVFRGVAATPRGSQHHPSLVWESHKDEIRRLYLDEQKPLRAVVETMAQRHNFHATPRMYKIRTAQWGFKKNNKRPAEERRKRWFQPKKCGRRPVQGVLYDAYAPAGEEMFYNEADLAVDPAWLVGARGHLEDNRMLTFLDLPETLRFRESFISGIRELIARHYTLESKLYRGVVPFLGHILSESRQAVNDLIQASWFYGQGAKDQAFMTALARFYDLTDFFKDRHFYSLLYLFISIFRWRDPGLMSSLLNCLAYNARSKAVPASAPRLPGLLEEMRDFCRSEGFEEFASIVSDSLREVFTIADEMHNPDDFCMTWLKCDYAWSIGLDPDWIEKLLSRVVHIRHSLSGGVTDEELQDWSESMETHRQVFQRLYGGSLNSAFAYFQDDSDTPNKVRPEATTDAIPELCLKTMAQYYRAQREMDSIAEDPSYGRARERTSKSDAFIETRFEPGQEPSLSDLKELEEWNTKAECWSELEAAKTKWVEALWTMSRYEEASVRDYRL